MANSEFDKYLKSVASSIARGDATEHTHRPALKAFLESSRKSISATNEPKRIKAGAPDFRVYVGDVPIGYVETKDVGTNLDEIEHGKGRHGEQFQRFQSALPNWLLTDYLDFRWFVDGQKRVGVRIAQIDGTGKMVSVQGSEERLAQLLRSFLDQEAPVVSTARELAERLAGMAINVRALIIAALSDEGSGWLHKWLVAFRETLLPDMDKSLFADMFAQSIAYGLFTARLHTPSGTEFSRERSAYHLPPTNPFLRKLFGAVAGPEMPASIDWAVDDIVEVLKRTDIDAIQQEFRRAKGREDPVVYFYETFLQVYDPAIRERRGVYYTPQAVVRYIVESIDRLLQRDFGKQRGLADEHTLVLDPAVGTGTFLYGVIGKVYERFTRQKGAWTPYVSTHLLDRIFGFELLMAPYAIAHLKLGMELRNTGYTFETDQRLGVYLTNTLEEAITESNLPFAEWVSEEANAASAIKKDRPVLVVLGNPPYSGISANRTKDSDGRLTFIGQLMEDYKHVDGKPLSERKHWLQDDYVKFIRFAEWRINRTGEGIIGYITNHGYLANPTFRGMRRHLMKTFTHIYVYDLHGSQKKRERPPAGVVDRNVFDIRVGVAILLCGKTRGESDEAAVHHAELWGTREMKYDILSSSEVTSTPWTTLKPTAPEYLFVPVDQTFSEEYLAFPALEQIFPVQAVGAVTARDHLTIAFTKDELWSRVKDFSSISEGEARRKYNLGKDARDWKVSTAQADLRRTGPKKENIRKILVHPFDVRYTYYTGKARGFYASPCDNVVRHMFLDGNIGLSTSKRVETGGGFEHAFCTRHMIQHHSVSVKEVNYLFPLVLHSVGGTADQGTFGFQSVPNINHTIIRPWIKELGLSWTNQWRGDLKKTLGARDIFDYIYALLYSPMYRIRYGGQLLRGFPRIPLMTSSRQVTLLIGLGRQLADLHTLESEVVDSFDTGFSQQGSNRVDKLRYEVVNERVWINDTQFFDGVSQQVWEFSVGGYRVCERWLYDRRKRVLTFDDLQYFQRVTKAVTETQRVMIEIDKAIPAWALPDTAGQPVPLVAEPPGGYSTAREPRSRPESRAKRAERQPRD